MVVVLLVVVVVVVVVLVVLLSDDASLHLRDGCILRAEVGVVLVVVVVVAALWVRRHRLTASLSPCQSFLCSPTGQTCLTKAICR